MRSRRVAKASVPRSARRRLSCYTWLRLQPISLAASETVTIELFDISGAMVAAPVVDRTFAAGDHSATIPVGSLTPGAYMVRFSVGGYRSVFMRSIVVVR